MTTALHVQCLPATPLSLTVMFETGGFASPPCGGFALALWAYQNLLRELIQLSVVRD